MFVFVSRGARRILTLLAALGLVIGCAAVAPTSAQAAPLSRQLGWTATFPHFNVTVGNVVYSPAHGTLAYTVVCVRSLPPGSTGGRTRISWDPWRLTTTSGTVAPRVYDASHPPEGMFRAAGYYRPGDCAGGWIPYADASGAVTKISYSNSLGNQATWFAPPRTPNTNLGVTRTFSHFSVTVLQTTVDAGRYWAGARVKVCVRSASGFPGGVPITQTPWTLSANRGIFTTLIMQEGFPDFGPEFPWSTRLDVGECASGWIAFPISGFGSGIALNQVSYHNSLGHAASWRAR